MRYVYSCPAIWVGGAYFLSPLSNSSQSRRPCGVISALLLWFSATSHVWDLALQRREGSRPAGVNILWNWDINTDSVSSHTLSVCFTVDQTFHERVNSSVSMHVVSIRSSPVRSTAFFSEQSVWNVPSFPSELKVHQWAHFTVHVTILSSFLQGSVSDSDSDWWFWVLSRCSVLISL